MRHYSRACLKGFWLMEDAAGVHIVDVCFEEQSAEIMQLACTLCASRCQSAFFIYTKINTRIGYFPDFSSLGQLCMLQTLFLPFEGEKINCLSTVSCYCKLLCCQPSNIVNWPLMNPARHCLAAVLSQPFLVFCLWGFSHAHTVTVEGLSNTTQLTSHHELCLFFNKAL